MDKPRLGHFRGSRGLTMTGTITLANYGWAPHTHPALGRLKRKGRTVPGSAIVPVALPARLRNRSRQNPGLRLARAIILAGSRSFSPQFRREAGNYRQITR